MSNVVVRIVSTGSAPRALVIETPSWLGMLFGAERAEWCAFGVTGPAGIEWFRDTREERPRRITARRVLDALDRELTRSVAEQRLAAIRT